MMTVSLTWTSECGVSDAGILTLGKKERGKLICKKDQPHCLQSAGQKQMAGMKEQAELMISSLLDRVKELGKTKKGARPPALLLSIPDRQWWKKYSSCF